MPCSHTADLQKRTWARGRTGGHVAVRSPHTVEHRLWTTQQLLSTHAPTKALTLHEHTRVSRLLCSGLQSQLGKPGSPAASSLRRGREDRTHRTLTPQDPVASHRRESLVEWTGCTDPAPLEEKKNHVNAAQPQGPGRGGHSPCPGQPGLSLMVTNGEEKGSRRKCLTPWSDHEPFQKSWTDNPHVSLQASTALIPVLTWSCSSHHQGITRQKQHGLPHSLLCVLPSRHTLQSARLLLALLSPSLPGVTAAALTSVGDEDCLVLCLHVVLAAVRGRERNPVLAGVKLAVDLGAGPRQHLAESKEEQHSCLSFNPGLQQAPSDTQSSTPRHLR